MLKKAINWIAGRSGLVRKLQRELDASVEYHAHYRSRIDRALGQPRDCGDMLANHLSAIQKLNESISKMAGNGT